MLVLAASGTLAMQTRISKLRIILYKINCRSLNHHRGFYLFRMDAVIALTIIEHIR